MKKETREREERMSRAELFCQCPPYPVKGLCYDLALL